MALQPRKPETAKPQLEAMTGATRTDEALAVPWFADLDAGRGTAAALSEDLRNALLVATVDIAIEAGRALARANAEAHRSRTLEKLRESEPRFLRERRDKQRRQERISSAYFAGAGRGALWGLIFAIPAAAVGGIVNLVVYATAKYDSGSNQGADPPGAVLIGIVVMFMVLALVTSVVVNAMSSADAERRR